MLMETHPSHGAVFVSVGSLWKGSATRDGTSVQSVLWTANVSTCNVLLYGCYEEGPLLVETLCHEAKTVNRNQSKPPKEISVCLLCLMLQPSISTSAPEPHCYFAAVTRLLSQLAQVYRAENLLILTRQMGRFPNLLDLFYASIW